MTPAGLEWHDSGLCAFHGAALELYRGLDRLFASWAAEWGAQEHEFPPFLRAADLARLDYFQSFPHLATFPVVLDAEPSNLRAFACVNGALQDGALRFTGIAPAREVLTPAACYHFYPRLSGTHNAAPVYLTTRATCFRRETHYVPLRRQWSFSMREIVCLGSADEVQEFLARMQARLTAFWRSRAMAVEWRAATDPFFDPSRSPRYLAQKLDPVKTEMVLADGLAIGSVNFHRNYFGETFDIRRDGAPAFSACVAFGLERWMHAFAARYGEGDWGLS